MKKIFALMMTAMVLMSASMNAFAAETMTEPNGSKAIDVQAKAVYTSPENMYSVGTQNGKAEVTTSDGKKITVSAENGILNGLTLNVIEMVKGDANAYSWISGVMKGIADKFTAYDIYFTDKDGNRVSVTGNVAVTVTTPDGYENPKTFHITSDGKTEPIDSKQANSNTEFTASSFSYYVIADKADNNGGTTTPSDPSNPSDITKPADPNSPQTGDNSNMALWFALLFVSGCALIAFGVSKKRRKHSEE